MQQPPTTLRPQKHAPQTETPKKETKPSHADALAHARRFRPPPRRFLHKGRR